MPDLGTVPPDSGRDTGVDTGVDVDTGVEPDSGPADTGPVPLGPVNVDLEALPAQTLSEFAFFKFENGEFEYNEGVVPYTLNTPLFSDFALKARAIWLPPNTSIQYDATNAFVFPVGAAIIKSFLIAPDLRAPTEGVQIIETRVLINTDDGWRALPYLWRADQGDADYFVRGQVSEVELIDPLGNPRTAQYLVPQRNQCFECHELKDENDETFTTIIGPKARHLNRDNVYDGETKNQLTHLQDVGYLSGLPDLSMVEQAFEFQSLYATGTTALDAVAIERAARDYLDVNCAHCHNADAVQGVTSQLFLNYDSTDPFRLGICKEPGSAGGGAGGLQYDIVPGAPESSIMWFRMQTEDVGSMMPLLGRSLADDLGVQLIRAWIAGMPPMSCD